MSGRNDNDDIFSYTPRPGRPGHRPGVRNIDPRFTLIATYTGTYIAYREVPPRFCFVRDSPGDARQAAAGYLRDLEATGRLPKRLR